mgnify:CR=1 FL=1
MPPAAGSIRRPLLHPARQELDAAFTDLNAFYAREVEAYRKSLAAQNLALVPALPPLAVP